MTRRNQGNLQTERASNGASPKPSLCATSHRTSTAQRLLLGGLAALLSFAAYAQLAPSAPTGLYGRPKDRQVDLYWDTDTTVTSYSVRHATSTTLLASTSWTAIPMSGPNTSSSTVMNLTNGTRWYFQIRSTNSIGNSPASDTAAVGLPTSPTATVTVNDANLRHYLENQIDPALGPTLTQLAIADLDFTLRLSNRGISDLTGLEYALNVPTLNLYENSISDLTPLAGLTALTSLNLSKNSISNIAPLAGLTALTFLHLNENSISNIAPLAGLTALEWLNLNDNSISDATPLAGLTALTRLDMQNNSVSDATPLAGLVNLSTLVLRDNSIFDISPLASLTRMQQLDLNANSISDISPLASMTDMRFLLLAGNSISDVTVLAGMTLVYTLDLNRNSISDVSPLASLTVLRTLFLAANSISDVSPLLSNTGLGAGDLIELRGNPLTVRTATTDIPELQSRGVIVNFVAPTNNLAPEIVSPIYDASMALGARLVLDAANHFTDPNLDVLAFEAASATPSVATVRVDLPSAVTVHAIGAGVANITVSATDAGGLTASLSFNVVVADASFGGATEGTASVSAPEGGVANLVVSLGEARDDDVSFRYTLGVDADPDTADADTEDYGEVPGTLTIPAGDTSAPLLISILDDDDIEPAREVFTVTLEEPEGITLAGTPVVTVYIEEGVCDRSAAVREALSPEDDCTAPTPAHLAAVKSLALEGLGISALQADDFSGLPGLLRLNLSGNALTALPTELLGEWPDLRDLNLSNNRLSELPDGLFDGLENLRLVRLDGNPGTPFALQLAVERTDAAPWAPGPAMLRLTAPTGVPFDVDVALAATGTTLRGADGEPVTSAQVPAGATSSAAFIAAASAVAAQITATAPPLPDTMCDGLPCWRGFGLSSGAPLTLYVAPPQAGETPAPEPLYGDALRLPLDALVSVGTDGALRWTATSSDESVAIVRVVGDELVVEPVHTADGAARIEVSATNAVGQSATVVFNVQVEFYWPVRQAVGWRGGVVVMQAE